MSPCAETKRLRSPGVIIVYFSIRGSRRWKQITADEEMYDWAAR
jgi:hypothetical protein